MLTWFTCMVTLCFDSLCIVSDLYIRSSTVIAFTMRNEICEVSPYVILCVSIRDLKLRADGTNPT